jgi:hypothetical protein
VPDNPISSLRHARLARSIRCRLSETEGRAKQVLQKKVSYRSCLGIRCRRYPHAIKQPHALFSSQSHSYRAGKSVEVEEPEMKEGKPLEEIQRVQVPSGQS